MSKLPATMHAVEIKEFGPAEGLVLTERPVPIPNDGEVLIRVSYAGVNRPDVQQRLGGYPPPPGASDIPGLEIAGEIVNAAKNTNHWKPGDVCNFHSIENNSNCVGKVTCKKGKWRGKPVK